MEKTPVEAGKAVAAIDTALVEVLDGEKNCFSTMAREATGKEAVPTDDDENHTEGSDSDPPADANRTHHLSDELVAFILAMPRDCPVDDEEIPFMMSKHDLAKLLNKSEEWIEEQRQSFKEDATRDQKIYDEFAPFQDWIRDEFFEKGYVEVDEESLKQVAELEEYSRGLWDDLVKSGGLDGLNFADPSDPRCAVGYY